MDKDDLNLATSDTYLGGIPTFQDAVLQILADTRTVNSELSLAYRWLSLPGNLITQVSRPLRERA